MLARLSRPQRRDLVRAMRGIEDLLGKRLAGPRTRSCSGIRFPASWAGW